jgi:glycosyltransferase involved in cell wall biosynthesis
MRIAILSPQSPKQQSSSAVARLEMFQHFPTSTTFDYYYFGELADPKHVSLGEYLPEGHPKNFAALKTLITLLKKAHSEHPYDCLWTTLPPIMMALFAVQAKKSLKIPLVVDVRDPGISSARLAVAPTNIRYKAAWALEKRIYNAADAICCTTPELTEFLSKEFSIPAKKFHVISNAGPYKKENTSQYTGKGPLKIFFAGTFAPYQVVKPFIELLVTHAAALKHDFTFTFYGYQEKGENLPAIIGDNTEWISLHGRVSREEALKEMESAHAVLVPIHGLDMPELYDYAIPLKYYEALAHSKPVVLFGGTAAVVNAMSRDKAGIHCPIDGALVSCLTELADNYKKYQHGASEATYLRSEEAAKLATIITSLCTSHS